MQINITDLQITQNVSYTETACVITSVSAKGEVHTLEIQGANQSTSIGSTELCKAIAHGLVLGTLQYNPIEVVQVSAPVEPVKHQSTLAAPVQL